MRIELNGTAHELAETTTVGALIVSTAGAARGTAAVVDGEVVPRSEWATLLLHDGQIVELITAVQGG